MKKYTVVGLIVAATLGFVPSAGSQQQIQSPASDLQPKIASASGQQETERRLVRIRDGRLTLIVQNGSLGSILDELARVGRITIVHSDGVGDNLISADLKSTTLESGLRQILNAYDAFFYYAADAELPATLNAVWVFAKGEGRGLLPAPPAWASTKEIEAKLGDPDPLVRSRAYEALLDRKGNDALDEITRLLKEEKSDDVRARVLSAALSRDLALPVDLRIALASTDASEAVRILALDTLRGDPNLPAVANAALTDPSPSVRIKAQEIINDLGISQTAPTGQEQ